MIVDTSAIVAIVRGEADAERYAEKLATVVPCRMSAATYLEAAVVVDAARDPVASRAFDELIDTAGIEVMPVTAVQAEIARAAYRDFGRGSAHPARLNFGDCFAYALAASRREPILFKSDDFGHTGLRSALDPLQDV